MSTNPATRVFQNYDVVIYILDHLAEYYSALYRCTLVNRTFNAAASRLLYRQVIFSPPYRRAVINLRRKDEFAEGVFPSACLSRNARHVLKLEISGHLSARPPPFNRLSIYLQNAIPLWENLHTIEFTPLQYHADLFSTIIPLLRACRSLRRLSVNASCTEESRVAELIQLQGLEELTISSPTRAILQHLPQWLDSLSGTLKSFHLKDNCGSITPGVLNSFLPHLEEIHAYSLGLSYSLTDDDFFRFINALSNLSSLDFRYYLQLRPVSIHPTLTALQHLTIRHVEMRTASDVTRLCTWIRHLLRHSSLRSLALLSEHPSRGVSPAFDGLAQHIAFRHFRTITTLSLATAFVGREALRTLCSNCVHIEELAVAVTADVLAEISEIIVPLVRLHTLHLETRNIKPSHLMLEPQDVQTIMRNGTTSLRHLSINGLHWEGEWTATPDQNIEFVVQQVSRTKLPWEQTT